MKEDLVERNENSRLEDLCSVDFWYEVMDVLCIVFLLYLVVSEEVVVDVFRNLRVIDVLFNLLWDIMIRDFVFNYIFLLMKVRGCENCL